MDVAKYSTAVKMAEVQSSASVKVFKGASDQAEAVAAILIQGIEDVAQVLPDGKGQNLNVVA